MRIKQATLVAGAGCVSRRERYRCAPARWTCGPGKGVCLTGRRRQAAERCVSPDCRDSALRRARETPLGRITTGT